MMALQDESSGERNRARASFKVRSAAMDIEVDVTPRGLMAIGFLVSAILLSIAPIVVAATRKLPPR